MSEIEKDYSNWNLPSGQFESFCKEQINILQTILLEELKKIWSQKWVTREEFESFCKEQINIFQQILIEECKKIPIDTKFKS
jgi:hypothetical protein